MAKPNSKELKKAKELAEMLLEAQGIDHDEWLYEQYLKIQSENAEIIESAMNFYLTHMKTKESQPFLGSQLENNSEI
ncbi:Uncharacterised protein [[Clostridium] sordellii]|uniref:hypothetical protein n=1 Tax=Paraclostridium sordellii TaxID=1505 RepID=UPI0005E00140|nr:hypothetical protein [Paeniclostridium sordellii]CEN25345.1 Uncharacterised protein [[Clostridium] sordellii] [Paeniclostridium sordellii]